MRDMRKIGIAAAHEVIVDTITPGTPAESWGLRAGDRFQSIEGTPVTSIETISEHLAEHPGQGFTLVVLRNGKKRSANSASAGAKGATWFSGS